MTAIILMVMGVALILLGLYMVIYPQGSVKKEVTVEPEVLQQVKRSGISQIIFGLVIAAVGLLSRMFLH
jgi:hypothetical protein